MTAFERVLGALEAAGSRVQRSPGGARAQCPVHGSRGLTLSIRGGDGRATITCFAGCEDTAVLEAVGLGIGDLFDEAKRPEYVPLKPEPTPWDQAMTSIGVHPPYPSLDHVLDRMVTERRKERRAVLREAEPELDAWISDWEGRP